MHPCRASEKIHFTISAHSVLLSVISTMSVSWGRPFNGMLEWVRDNVQGYLVAAVEFWAGAVRI